MPSYIYTPRLRSLADRIVQTKPDKFCRSPKSRLHRLPLGGGAVDRQDNGVEEGVALDQNLGIGDVAVEVGRDGSGLAGWFRQKRNRSRYGQPGYKLHLIQSGEQTSSWIQRSYLGMVVPANSTVSNSKQGSSKTVNFWVLEIEQQRK